MFISKTSLHALVALNFYIIRGNSATEDNINIFLNSVILLLQYITIEHLVTFYNTLSE